MINSGPKNREQQNRLPNRLSQTSKKKKKLRKERDLTEQRI